MHFVASCLAGPQLDLAVSLERCRPVYFVASCLAGPQLDLAVSLERCRPVHFVARCLAGPQLVCKPAGHLSKFYNPLLPQIYFSVTLVLRHTIV